jgi:predicted amidophosphoribosyltransferase
VRSIKNEARQFSQKWKLAEFVLDNLGEERVERFLGNSTTLVPMPGHAPLKDEGSRWPARELCEEFVRVGLGANWMPLLSRASRVPKAAFASPAERPTAPMHYRSLRCEGAIGPSARITVVDDVITRGATMLAAISLLQQTYPNADVAGFSLIRTMSDEPIHSVTDPASGVISLHGEETRRRP